MVRYSRLGTASMSQHIGAPERLHEEKTERGGALRHGVAGQFSHAKQVSLKLPDLFGTELVG